MKKIVNIIKNDPYRFVEESIKILYVLFILMLIIGVLGQFIKLIVVGQ